MNPTRMSYRPVLGCSLTIKYELRPAPRRSLGIRRPRPEGSERLGIIRCKCGVATFFDLNQEQVTVTTGVGGAVESVEMRGLPACKHWELLDERSNRIYIQ